MDCFRALPRVRIRGSRFYGSANAAARGHADRPTRGTQDPFELDLRGDPHLEALSLDAETEDGYIRDTDRFTDGFTVQDGLALIVDYASGATLSYSLNAHSPSEGQRVAVISTERRIELGVVERRSLAESQGPHPVLDPSYSAVEADSLRPISDRLILHRR